MPNNKREPSRQQRRQLEAARHVPSSEAVRLLYHTVDGIDDEPLDPEWRDVWHRIRDEVIAEVPPGVVEEIDAALAGIPHLGRLEHVGFDRTSNVCILLGAGASASAPSSIPTVAQLLPELWRRARKLGRDDIDKLAAWCDHRNISNIEDLLTAAYLANFAAKNSAVSGLLDYFLFRQQGRDDAAMRRRFRNASPTSHVDASSVALFQETLQGLFGLLTSTMIPAPPNSGHEEIATFAQSHSTTSVITTNYDGCLDEALLRSGASIRTHVMDAPASNRNEGMDLIKIHGSINWSYCESCHEVKEFDLLDLKDGFLNDTISYAVVGICKNCGGQRRPLLIPPIGLKFIMFPNLIRLWNLARERIEKADILLVVGFSFSEADSYINKIIERSMSINDSQTMIVCDPNPALVRSLRDRYAARIQGFRPDRIIEAVGESASLLPDIFSELRKNQGSSQPSGADSEAADFATAHLPPQEDGEPPTQVQQ